MKQFLGFLLFIFFGLGLAWHLKKEEASNTKNKINLKVFATSSFTSAWGPGPQLKTEFEKKCDCTVEYFDSQENAILFQRLRSQKENSIADVVLSLDQNDIEQAKYQLNWLDLTSIAEIKKDFFSENIKAYAQDPEFLPYDYAPISFVYDSQRTPTPPLSLDDLLKPEFKNQIAIPDPRLSSVGFQFLNWLIQVKGESEAFAFLERLNSQVKSYPPSWSSSYSLFNKNEVSLTLSYTTSPLYHELEEKKSNIKAALFRDGHPLQVEFIGIPESCSSCDKAKEFVEFFLSDEAQTIIMKKNYMLPAISSAKDNSAFAQLPPTLILPKARLPSTDERIEILERWIKLRR